MPSRPAFRVFEREGHGRVTMEAGDSADLIDISALCESEDPCDGNRFPATDWRHKIWADATLEAEPQSHLLNAAYIVDSRKLPRPQSLAEARRLILARVSSLITAKFDRSEERSV